MEQRFIRFDPHRRVDNADLKTTIEAFADYLETCELELGLRTRRRRRTDLASFRLAVEAISCNLMVAAMVAPRTTVAVPRGHDVMWGKDRYASPVYGQHFVAALDLMAHPKIGLVRATKGWRRSKNNKKPSTITATHRLSDHLPLDQAGWPLLCRAEEPETIILKATAKKEDDEGIEDEAKLPIDYKDTGKTRKWRRQMRKINAWLASAPIALEQPDSPKARLDRQGVPVDPNRRTLCRHFNNGRWDHGGRLFGGFWMHMAREDRFECIRIAGEPIANVDYGQLFPRLAYMRAQADQPETDIYDITGDGTFRAGWKKLINALLFATRPKKQWSREIFELFPKGTKLRHAVKAAKEKHAPIADLFEKGLGFNLMHIESELLVTIVTALFKQGITALPLHDSVLVARSQAETAKAIMATVFELFMGQRCATVSIDYGIDK